jgi:hypothetical protein
MLTFDDSADRTEAHVCDFDPTSSADLDWVEIIMVPIFSSISFRYRNDLTWSFRMWNDHFLLDMGV